MNPEVGDERGRRGERVHGDCCGGRGEGEGKWALRWMQIMHVAKMTIFCSMCIFKYAIYLRIYITLVRTLVVECALKRLAEAALLQSLNEQKHIFSVVSP